MGLLGVDSGRYGGQPQQVQEIVLATGNRADLLVTTGAGNSELRALPYDRGGTGGMMGGGPAAGPGPSGTAAERIADRPGHARRHRHVRAGAAAAARAIRSPRPAQRDDRGGSRSSPSP